MSSTQPLIQLTAEQESAYRKATQQHRNLFVSGPAGTGKSFLLRKMIQEFHRQSKRVAVTSLTGISASLLPGGYTFHHWLGTKYIPDIESKSYIEILDLTYRNLSQHAKTRIRNTDVLIIDEISMMPYYMFGLLDDISKQVRKNPYQSIGGIQLIAIGDFHQLPPVKYTDRNAKYVFQHPLWNKVFPPEKGHVHILKQIVRQKDDELFRNVLTDMRNGKLRLEYERLLCSKIKPLANIPETIPRLYAVKRDIDEMNQARLDMIEGESRIFCAKITSKIPAMAGKIDFPKDTLIVDKLTLKVGAFVMFNKNIIVDKTNPTGRFIANGQCGTVVDLEEKNSGFPVVEYRTENGMVCRYIVRPETWEYPMFSVTQFPLMLAWNISIHKSQGSTLEQVAIDVGDTVFEYGQMYVALSRCRSLDGLTLIKFQPRKLKTDPLVKEFYERMNEYISEIQESKSAPVTTEPSPVVRKRTREEDLDSRDREIIQKDINTSNSDSDGMDTDDMMDEIENPKPSKPVVDFRDFLMNRKKQ